MTTAEPERSANQRRSGEPHGRRQPQIFARDLRLPVDAPLVYLARGTAANVRDDARAGHLRCPLPGCGDGRLTTRSGPRVRDHFVHLSRSDGPHGYETLAHHTAKHLLGRHLRQQFPNAEVWVDSVAVASGARPDVLLELPGGRQVAYEVQYAALTSQEWQSRHERYAADGIRDVWLFGGPRYQRKPRYVALEGVRIIGPTLAMVLSAGQPLLLIESNAEQVALGGGFSVVAALGGETRGLEFTPSWFPLDQARWPGGVLELPGMREVLAQGKQYRWDREVRRRQTDVGLRLVKEHQARIAQRGRVWQERRRELEQQRGPLPKIVDVPLPPPRVPFFAATAVGLDGEREVMWPLETQPPAQWRWQLLQALETGLGDAVDIDWLSKAAFGCRSNRDRGVEVLGMALLGQLLGVLRDGGYIWFAGTTRPADGEGILVLGGADTPPRVPDRFARRLLIRGTPTVLIDGPRGALVWEAFGAAAVTSVRRKGARQSPGRTAILPGATGRLVAASEGARWLP
ncbi:hypothetical protein GCM10009616_28860 [Microlunatus lacustris]